MPQWLFSKFYIVYDWQGDYEAKRLGKTDREEIE